MSGARLTKRQREDVALCAMTMAWCAGLRWHELPLAAPVDMPWQHDKEAFIQTALVILGHRDIHARDYMGIPKDYGRALARLDSGADGRQDG